MKRIINPTTLRLLMAATAFVALAFSRQPRVLPAAAASAGRAETAAAPNYQGHFDAADCNTITGWAADTNRQNTPINVSIFDGPTLLTTVLANLPRPDVGSVLGDNGLHGFTISFPPSLKDTHPHTVDIRFESTNIELPNSPLTVAPCVTPPEGTGEGVRLELTLKINDGAETTKDRSVSLNFDAREVTASGSRHEANITEYRVVEVGLNQALTNISASPWKPFNLIGRGIGRGLHPPLSLELALRNDFGERYGERRVLLQVKTAQLTSDVASDTITLEPVLKEYTIHANADHTHPLVQYAASQGFKFPRTFFQACSGGHGGSSPSDISSGFANIAGGTLNSPPSSSQVACNLSPKCETRFEYELFDGRQLNKFWHIKSVNVSGADAKFHGVNHYLLKGHVIAQTSADCPSGTICTADSVCVPAPALDPNPTVTIGDIVIEGPEEDDFVNAANPWENAFVQPLIIHPPPPGTRPVIPPQE